MPYKILILALLFTTNVKAQQTVGVFLNDSLSFDGYTLLIPSSFDQTKLIDNCGHVVNAWDNIADPGLAGYLLENGNLLRTNRFNGNGFGGGGTGGRITLQDWEGNMLWNYVYSSPEHHQHHDIEYLPNGNILILAWERHTYEEGINMGRDSVLISSEIWTEQIVEVQPIGLDSGIIVWEWHLKDHLIQENDSTKLNFGVVKDHPELIDFNYVRNISADWVHLNSVDYNAELDQIMVNSRHLHELWVIDHSTTKDEAASHEGGNSGKGGDILYRWGNPQFYQRGDDSDKILGGPHDCHWVTDSLTDGGKIMIFNNGFDNPNNFASSVLVIDPPVDEFGNYTIPDSAAFDPQLPSWKYPEFPDQDFFSQNISGAQRLPNGNTLICEGASGHLFEVTYDGDVVWDYVNPLTAFGPTDQNGSTTGNSVFRAYRYGPDYPAFQGRDMTPGDVIELNPDTLTCEINITSIIDEDRIQEAQYFPAFLANNQLSIQNPSNKELNIALYDLTGRVIFIQNFDSNRIEITLDNLPVGIYFLRFADHQNHLITTQKLIQK